MPVVTNFVDGPPPSPPLTAEDLNSAFALCGAVGDPNVSTNEQTLVGTTAGNIYSSMPEQGVSKKLVAAVVGYENDTTTNQTITFPKAFTYTPVAIVNTSGLTLSVSTTTLTITAPNATTVFNGLIIVEGL
ncbi:MAG: hypothetical protein ACYCRF_11225 [Acidithiobacillus sp.]